MPREFYLGQKPPTSQLAEEKFNVVPAEINVTADDVDKMSAQEYQNFINRPGAADAVDRAYELAKNPPAPVPAEVPAEVPPPTE